MTEDEAKPYAKPIPYWIPETRTVIVCWMMLSTFIIILLLITVGPPKGEGRDLLNTLLGMYVGVGLNTSITWWMGDAKGNDVNNKMKDKMSDTLQAAQPPAAPNVVVSWWSLMEPDEKTAIEARSKTDSKIKTIYEALMAGKAEPPDIAALVAAGLLKQERAENFKTA